MEVLLPFDQRVQLFINDLKLIAKARNIIADELTNQFSFRYKENKIWYEIIEPANEQLIVACIKSYRLHFPEGQGQWMGL
jgi:hypothetical protein